MTALFLVVARAANGVIGVENQLPWRIPADLRRFKALTLGKPVIMGRRTFESIGRPLPDRRNIVLSRDPDWSAPGVERAESLDGALGLVAEAPEAAIIGGEAVFAESLPRAVRLELTEVRGDYEGDARFPAFHEAAWREIWREDHAGTADSPPFSFRTLVRP